MLMGHLGLVVIPQTSKRKSIAYRNRVALLTSIVSFEVSFSLKSLFAWDRRSFFLFQVLQMSAGRLTILGVSSIKVFPVRHDHERLTMASHDRNNSFLLFLLKHRITIFLVTISFRPSLRRYHKLLHGLLRNRFFRRHKTWMQLFLVPLGFFGRCFMALLLRTRLFVKPVLFRWEKRVLSAMWALLLTLISIVIRIVRWL